MAGPLESRADARNRELTAKIKRNAWTIAVLAVAFYIGFIAWNLYRASAGL
jgi:uncharacterized membrane protein (DUF485 family)